MPRRSKERLWVLCKPRRLSLGPLGAPEGRQNESEGKFRLEGLQDRKGSGANSQKQSAPIGLCRMLRKTLRYKMSRSGDQEPDPQLRLNPARHRRTLFHPRQKPETRHEDEEARKTCQDFPLHPLRFCKEQNRGCREEGEHSRQMNHFICFERHVFLLSSPGEVHNDTNHCF
jgi:hypothetical protein